jgi:2OG-Fe(II) oxygenase superfamily
MAKKKPPRPSNTPSTNRIQISFPSIPPPAETPIPITLLPSQILLLQNFLSPATCKEYVSHFSSLQLLPSPPPGRNEAIRTNARLATEDPQFAKRLFVDTGLSQVTKDWSLKLGKRTLQVKGLHSNIRIYRYDEGTFFGPHYDSSTRDAVTGYTSYWTLLVYLTGVEDGVQGGETVFYEGRDEKEIIVSIERGLALLHRHGGSDCLLHEGRTVTKGAKWVLRSDLMFG